jgi:hypothetical protein
MMGLGAQGLQLPGAIVWIPSFHSDDTFGPARLRIPVDGGHS